MLPDGVKIISLGPDTPGPSMSGAKTAKPKKEKKKKDKKKKNKPRTVYTCVECNKTGSFTVKQAKQVFAQCKQCKVDLCKPCANGPHLRSASHSEDAAAITSKCEEPTHYTCDQCHIRVGLWTVNGRKKRRPKKCQLCKFNLCAACANGAHVKAPTRCLHAISQNVYCPILDQTFLTVARRDRHFEKHHNTAIQYRCCDCELDFPTNCELDKHFKEVSHENRLVCPKCQRVFKKTSTLNKHLSTHKDIQCIGSSKCTREFARFADMVQHLESGACCSKLNRAKVHELLLQHDTANAITIPGIGVQRLSAASAEITESLDPAKQSLPVSGTVTQVTAVIEELGANAVESFNSAKLPLLASERITETTTVIEELDPNADSDDEGDGGVPILTPTTTTPPLSRRSSISSTLSPGVLTPTTGPSSFEADFTKCPLCPERDFISAAALRMHLLSAAHAPKIYRCPTFLFDIPGQDDGKAVKREFNTLGGLLMHLQSGRCAGGQEMLENALRFVEGKLRAGGVRLLAEVS